MQGRLGCHGRVPKRWDDGPRGLPGSRRAAIEWCEREPPGGNEDATPVQVWHLTRRASDAPRCPPDGSPHRSGTAQEPIGCKGVLGAMGECPSGGTTAHVGSRAAVVRQSNGANASRRAGTRMSHLFRYGIFGGGRQMLAHCPQQRSLRRPGALDEGIGHAARPTPPTPAPDKAPALQLDQVSQACAARHRQAPRELVPRYWPEAREMADDLKPPGMSEGRETGEQGLVGTSRRVSPVRERDHLRVSRSNRLEDTPQHTQGRHGHGVPCPFGQTVADPPSRTPSPHETCGGKSTQVSGSETRFQPGRASNARDRDLAEDGQEPQDADPVRTGQRTEELGEELHDDPLSKDAILEQVRHYRSITCLPAQAIVHRRRRCGADCAACCFEGDRLAAPGVPGREA